MTNLKIAIIGSAVVLTGGTTTILTKDYWWPKLSKSKRQRSARGKKGPKAPKEDEKNQPKTPPSK